MLIDAGERQLAVAWLASAAVVVLVGLPLIVALMRVERVPQSTEATAPGTTPRATGRGPR